MAKQILFLSVALCTLVGVTFLLSYLAATMAQTTRVVGSALVAAGVSDDILQSHPAEEGIPVALCPLLSAKDLGRVKELTVSNLGYFDANDEYHLCATCAKTMVIQVDVALKQSDSVARFARTGGIAVTVNTGLISVQNVPFQDPSRVFTAYGSATCSSIRIAGVNTQVSTQALTKRAKALGYGQLGTRREVESATRAA